MINTLLPKNILIYCSSLLYAPFKCTITALSLILGINHDKLGRILYKKYHWKEILMNIACEIDLNSGYLIVDETEVNKSYSKITNGLSWLYSHKEKRHLFCYQIILICWTNGKKTFPLAWKIYSKGGKTKTDLAIELMSYCLYVLRIKPQAFLFDAFYASEKILSFLEKNNQDYFTQVPRNRLFDGLALKKHEKGRPYWMKIGYLKNKIKVQLVKNRRKYYITNRIGMTRKEQLATYKIRWQIELIFRFVKSQLGLEHCQSTSKQVQQNHFGCCFLVYALLQDTVQKTGLSLYAIRKKATLECLNTNNVDLTSYFNSA